MVRHSSSMGAYFCSHFVKDRETYATGFPSCIILASDAQPTFVNVLDKFDQFCKPRVSVFTARNQFLTMKLNTRSIDEFLTMLKKKVRECTFGDLTNDMALHALTLGLDQERTRLRLFEMENLILDKTIGICRLAADTEVEIKTYT